MFWSSDNIQHKSPNSNRSFLCLYQENNTAYQAEEFSQQKFDKTLSEILDKIEPNKTHSRNSLVLNVNDVIANGDYGDIVSGRIQSKSCHVHVISGMLKCINVWQGIYYKLYMKIIYKVSLRYRIILIENGFLLKGKLFSSNSND